MPRGVVAFIFVALLLVPTAACARHAEPLPYVEILTGGATAGTELPLIIALHGRGDTAEDFASLFRDFKGRARVAVLRPPRVWGSGQAWFLEAYAHAQNRPATAAELLALADRVAATAEAIGAKHPTRGRPLVMGFSQGGMLAWAVAIAHPRAISASFPVAGFLFAEILEKTHVDAAAMPPIVAFHGDADPLVPVAEDRRGVRALEKRGVHAALHVHPGLGHTLAPGLRADLFAAMARALAR